MFQWTPDMIRFMQDASEFCDYHKKLAEKIARELPPRASLCDAGCGLGYLSLALAPCCGSVTAVDAAPAALAVLEQKLQSGAYPNVTARCGDILTMPPKIPYDAMVFCFFGQTEQILRIAKAQCSGRAVILKKNWQEHRFTLGHKRMEHETFPIMQEKLHQYGIPFRAEHFTLEMGQPLRSVEDAVRFFHTYSKDDDPAAITQEEIIALLKKTGSEEFPYYLPQPKPIGYLVLETGAIPDTI